LNIPYVIVEASHAPKQEHGPWSMGYHASHSALSAASAVVALNRADIACVEPVLASRAVLQYMRPFLQPPVVACPSLEHRRSLSRRYSLDTNEPWLLTVAMMRDGDKFSSYQTLFNALQRIDTLAWQLLVVGDGTCRERVQHLFKPLKNRVAFAGQLRGSELVRCYSNADVFVWPAINEAFGMALLEAQSSALPVVAGRAGGVADVVENGRTGLLTKMGDAQAFAESVRYLLTHESVRKSMGERAARRVREIHSVKGASRQLNELLSSLV